MTGSHAAVSASGSRRMRLGDTAWLGVLVIVAVVQLVRAQWLDAAVFFAVASLVAFAPRRNQSQPGDEARAAQWPLRRRLVAVLGVIFLLAALVAPRHSLLMQLLIGAVGLAVLTLAWPQRTPDAPTWSPGLRRLGWAWGSVIVIGCLWELGQFIAGLLHPDAPSFALSDLVNPLLDHWPGLAGFVVAWGGVLAYLLRRGHS